MIPIPRYRKSLDWMDEGLCRQVDPEIFHPETGANHEVAAAKKVCFVCPVRSECLSWAIENPALGGILGGTTERQRITIRNKRRQRREAS